MTNWKKKTKTKSHKELNKLRNMEKDLNVHCMMTSRKNRILIYNSKFVRDFNSFSQSLKIFLAQNFFR